MVASSPFSAIDTSVVPETYGYLEEDIVCLLDAQDSPESRWPSYDNIVRQFDWCDQAYLTVDICRRSVK